MFQMVEILDFCLSASREILLFLLFLKFSLQTQVIVGFVPFQTTFLSNIQLSVMRDSWQGRLQEFIHRSCALRLLNPFTTLRIIIFPPSRPYTSSSSYRNEERLKRKIEMHLSSKLYKPLLYLLVRRKHLGV